tara:strand:+ start:1562 stop:2536 length:975 start_codon:yes stop_codon:yes gene_type:complete
MNYYFSTLYTVYALELSHKKWFIYVSSEHDIKDVYLNSQLQHEYIANHLPILSHNSTNIHDVLDIDYFVKKYMRMYGINNVRGGSYSNEILSSNTKEVLEKEINASFNDYNKYIDTSIDDYKKISLWSSDKIKETKKELLRKQDLFTIENEQYNTLQKPFHNSNNKISRQLIVDFNWLNNTVNELINDYITVYQETNNIMNEEVYEVSSDIQDKYTSFKEKIYGLNQRFYETYEGENYLYSTYDEINNYINTLEPFFLIIDEYIDFDSVILNKYNVLRQVEYMIYSLINLLDEYTFDVNSYPENFTFITNWKLQQLENIKLNDQ